MAGTLEFNQRVTRAKVKLLDFLALSYDKTEQDKVIDRLKELKDQLPQYIVSKGKTLYHGSRLPWASPNAQMFFCEQATLSCVFAKPCLAIFTTQKKLKLLDLCAFDMPGKYHWRTLFRNSKMPETDVPREAKATHVSPTDADVVSLSSLSTQLGFDGWRAFAPGDRMDLKNPEKGAVRFDETSYVFPELVLSDPANVRLVEWLSSRPDLCKTEGNPELYRHKPGDPYTIPVDCHASALNSDLVLKYLSRGYFRLARNVHISAFPNKVAEVSPAEFWSSFEKGLITGQIPLLSEDEADRAMDFHRMVYRDNKIMTYLLNLIDDIWNSPTPMFRITYVGLLLNLPEKEVPLREMQPCIEILCRRILDQTKSVVYLSSCGYEHETFVSMKAGYIDRLKRYKSLWGLDDIKDRFLELAKEDFYLNDEGQRVSYATGTLGGRRRRGMPLCGRRGRGGCLGGR